MDTQSASTQPLPRPNLNDTGPTDLHGWQLHAARTAWAVLYMLGLVVFGVSNYNLFLVNTLPCAVNPDTTWLYCAEWQSTLADWGISLTSYGGYLEVLRLLAALPYFILAVLLVRRRPNQLRVLLLSTLLVVLGAAGPWRNPWFDVAPNHVPALVIPARLLFALLRSGIIFGYIFPDGRFVPHWTRWLAVIYVSLAFLAAFFAGSPLSFETWPFPLPFAINIGFAGTMVYALLYRYRHVASSVQRQQIKWVLAGGSLLVALYFVDLVVTGIYPSATGHWFFTPIWQWVIWELGKETLWYTAQFLLAVCIGLSVLRYRLWDIDLIVNRTLVYGGLTASVVVIYVLVVGSLGALFQVQVGWLASLLGTGLVAVLFQPLRERFQRAVNRLMFGERDDPYAVLSNLGRRLEANLSPEAVPQTIVETVVQVLKLPYTAIELHRDGAFEVVASAGTPANDPLRLPLIYQGETVGRLVLSLRGGEESFSPMDRRVLEGIAHQAGVAVQAVSLMSDLQRSRERLVTAREEERRRLRRDLHDGLGPTLASLFQRLDTAGGLIKRDPEAAVALIGNLKEQVKTTIADLRQLVYALRPPALDEFGLVVALREHATQLSETSGIKVAFAAPESLPPLPAAVEVAAYRICVEALTNVVRHSQARSCHLRLTLSNGVCLEILDNGRGLPPGYHAGVGVSSMRERAAEVGGECSVERGPAGGTRVWARLPITE